MSKVIPIQGGTTIRERLLQAVEETLVCHGFEAITIDMVARAARVSRPVVFRYYGGLSGLVFEYSRTNRFWPSSGDLVDSDLAMLKTLPSAARVAEFFKRLLHELRKRPHTIELLCWECRQRNRLTTIMENSRVKSSLEFFESVLPDIDDDVDLGAIVAVIAAAAFFLLVRSRTTPHFGGIDLASPLGQQRIDDTIDLLLQGTLPSTWR
ncbi:TetR/AcrR family transcriptional regulator [Desulfovibrio inopinatus]|uniref:TetR/AcrR family transcriptional regulator n=1 Tax=Desulfovibrio inopinatus TaxID=102109 RepID=UPI000429D6CA|nr:TetR/AcrR family transcriptional regulator [Desulfovibrio inopinatus]